MMKRRQFISLLGGAAAAWPVAARGQQPALPVIGMRRVGVLMNTDADDPGSQARLMTFLQEMQRLGWLEGRNVQIDRRWSPGDVKTLGRRAVELVASAPDAILAGVGPTTPALLQATRTVPIVFAQAIDPVGNSFIATLKRPGGNVTGFTQFEYTLSGKWPELLKEIAPRVTRVAIIRNANVASGIGQWAVIQAAASSLGMEVSPIGVASPGEIERGIDVFAREANGGLIVSVAASASVHRQLIIAQAARHRLPAVYPQHHFVTDGGLVSYGPDLVSQYRKAAGYIDRILKGEKPADLPVQTPIRYELAINLKTAKALGLEVPPMLLARADEVIE